MKLTGNSRAVQLAIVALLVVTLWFACVRKADAEEPTFFAGAGAMYGSTNYQIAHGLRFGIEQGPWQASLVTHGSGAYEDPNGGRYVIEPNMGACGTWNVARKRLSIGFGACAWEHGDLIVGDEGPLSWDAATNTLSLDDDGIQLTAAISLRRTFGARERFYAEWFHASTSGATWYNRGKNAFLIGARF